MKRQVRNLEAAGVSEDMIVEHLGITHHQARQAMRNPEPRLSIEARKEIYYDTAHEHPGVELQRMYRVTEREMYKAKFTKPPKGTPPSVSAVSAAYAELTDFRLVAEHLDCSLAHVKRCMANYKYERPSREALLDRAEFLLRSNLPYTEIAAQLHCSVSTVSNLAKDLGLTRAVKREITNWPEILEYAATHSITATARHFGITRANIYYQQKKGK